MADDQWYYTQDDQRLGPVAFEALRGLAATGSLGAQEYVWQAGMPDWVAAHTVLGLMPVRHQMNAPQVAQPAYPGMHGQVPPNPYGGYAAPPQQRYAPQPAAMNYYSPSAGYLVPYAGFWLRFVAFVIDTVILMVGVGIVGYILGYGLGYTMYRGGASRQEIESTANVVGNILGFLANWLYFALMESSSKQATLGKMVMGLQVTNLQGTRVSFGQATGRTFAKIISALILCIGYFMAGWTERKQALHDSMSGCLVVRRR